MKLAIIFNDDKFSGKLTKFFTGLSAYHTAWVDEEAGLMYDQHLIRRRRKWPHYESSQVELFDFPQVTREFQEEKLTSDENTYGWIDYLVFGFRKVYHLLGKSTPNAGGVICSEMCNNDLRECNVFTPFEPFDAPPSPADLYRWCVSQKELGLLT